MAYFDFYLADSMTKVFPDRKPSPLKEKAFTVLKGQVVNLQLVYSLTDPDPTSRMQAFSLNVTGDQSLLEIRKVELVPSQYPSTPNDDTDYLSKTPGLYPDLLDAFEGKLKPVFNQYRSLWLQIDSSRLDAGTHNIGINIVPDKKIVLGNGEEVILKNTTETTLEFQIDVLAQTLPEQSLIHTEWFHTDCLADYYGVDAYSEAHWERIEQFIDYAVNRCGINTILTPVFTPPLDTEVGGSRTNVQLLQISYEGTTYQFDFSLLDRWCQICSKLGVQYLEISHFFTQWGAEFTPNIYVNGELRFGWHTKADSPEYKDFLNQLIPALLKSLEENSYTKDRLFFHISDEPEDQHLESYLKSKSQVEDLLSGYTIIDALSSYDFYQKDIVSHPVPANSAIQTFIDHNVEHLWTYYCVAQGKLVPNRFLSMPNRRNRIMGVLMYLYKIEGFLHWGYNFYSSQFSKSKINPFLTTDCDMAFPSGDAYLVYPGKEGPLGSIRNEIQVLALDDLRLLTYTESVLGRDKTIELVLGEGKNLFTFTSYPRYDEYFSELHGRIFQALGS
ncbi:DUF4091 domain-containing protein [Spirochaeta cellobiosiphila]|uniref:DUF4091 domain-containing protein n=1 Tax=Spirochaeta cellobiosiphila TaxID=504483 RepID=UPI0003FDF7E2|nr:DUF4091 domain-containing protein [Spirochaeta cellobiosiphila]